MIKVKLERTVDCVVAGLRLFPGPAVSSLILGLYDEDGDLWPVGVAASFAAAERKHLTGKLAPYRLRRGESHPWAPEGEFERLPGEPSRWSHGKDHVLPEPPNPRPCRLLCLPKRKLRGRRARFPVERVRNESTVAQGPIGLLTSYLHGAVALQSIAFQ